MAVLVVGLIATAGSVYAYGMKANNLFGNHDQIKEAIENGDYDTWKSLHEEGLTEERFNELVERDNQREKVRSAIENEDYEAWKIAMQNVESGNSELTEDDFNLIVQMHKARQSGDYDTVHDLMDELKDLGFVEPRERMGHGMRGHGQREGPKDGSRLGQGRMQGDCAFN